jgi:MOSC domain-containing protein YiiM
MLHAMESPRPELTHPRLLSVNVGRPRTVPRGEGTVETAIWKEPVSGRVAARGTQLEGDRQADPRVHGGHDKAVYAYAREDYDWWEQQLGRELVPGNFGENLTTEGIDLNHARVGDRWEVGGVLLEVSEPRLPCFKLGLRVGDPGFPERFAAAVRPGAYLRILREGDLGAGDEIRVVERPDHNVTMELMAEARLNRGGHDERLLAAPELPEKWRRRAAQAAAPSRAAMASLSAARQHGRPSRRA